jgi:PHP family Zn ribbon phosphoesterase
MSGNYDHDVIGVGNSNHPVNEEQLEHELTVEEELEEMIESLEIKLIESQQRVHYRISVIENTKNELKEVINYLETTENLWLLNKIKNLTIFN